jgi:hypothetical protein
MACGACIACAAFVSNNASASVIDFGDDDDDDVASA